MIEVFTEGIVRVIMIALQFFFWVTLAFAIAERADNRKGNEPLTQNLQEWTTDDLKSVFHIPKKKMIKKCDVFGGLFWTAIWATVYFYADHLAGIYDGGPDGLSFETPALNQAVLDAFWPLVVIVIVLEVALSIYKLIKRQWTNGVAFFNTILQITGFAVFLLIINQPDLFNPVFIEALSDLTTISSEQLVSGIKMGPSTIYLISILIAIWDGHRKARI